MAIQNRRGNYTDFDKTKMVAGEIAVVQSGDPIGSDGTAVYVAFQSGNAKRLATHEDIVNEISNATEEITNELVETIEQDVADDLSAAQTAASNASASASTASEKASEAAASATQAAQTVENIIDNTLTQSGKAADAKKVGDELSDLKEDLSELESDGTVANAEQLLSDKYTIDQVPYHYRQSASGGADREFDEIVGGTINWNQLIDENNPTTFAQNYVTYDENTHVYTVSYPEGSTASGDVLAFSLNTNYVEDHVYYNRFEIVDDSNYSSMRIYFVGSTTYVNTINTLRNLSNLGGLLTKASSTGVKIFHISKQSSLTTAQSISFKYQLFDLTKMFGTTVADHIYNLEQTTAGAGVALFRQLFPEDYYDYDAGTLMSVSGLQSHDMVGFNQFDEEIESGYLDNNGANAVNASAVRSKNYIPVFGGQSYCFTLENNTYVRFIYYDTVKSFIGSFEVNASTANGYVFTPPANARYMRFWVLKESANSDFCINLSSDRNGEYEPYEKHSYPLDSTLTLRGIPKLDSNNHIYFDGDTYASDGTVTRKYGIIDLGTLNWATSESIFYTTGLANTIKRPSNTEIANIVCLLYIATTRNDLVNNAPNKHIAISNTGNVQIIDSAYTTQAEFKTAMSGVMLVYELATPTTETAEPYTEVQKVDPYGTEEYVSTSIVPIGHYTKYPENLKAKIENLDLSMIAPIETGTTASQAYAVGKYFLLNNQFCKAKTAIASGATFTLNTNYEVTTVADELYTALNA